MTDTKKMYEDLIVSSEYNEHGIRTLWKDLSSKVKMEQLIKTSNAMMAASDYIYKGTSVTDTTQRLEVIRDSLEKELYALALKAKVISSEFYNLLESKDKTLEPINLSVRVRVTKDGYIEISWSKLEFFTVKGKNIKKSTRLSKGSSSFTYSMRTFEKTPKWAKEKVLDFEKRFAEIRERANSLSKIKRQLENYAKIIQKEQPKNEEKQQ